MLGGDDVRRALVNSFSDAMAASFEPNVGCGVFSWKTQKSV